MRILLFSSDHEVGTLIRSQDGGAYIESRLEGEREKEDGELSLLRFDEYDAWHTNPTWQQKPQSDRHNLEKKRLHVAGALF